MKKRFKRPLSLFVSVMMILALVTFFPSETFHFGLTVDAVMITSSYTVESDETYTASDGLDLMCFGGGTITFTNKGITNVSGDFQTYKSSFINEGTFTFTGSDSTFDISEGCSFTNSGKATISGCYNLGAGVSFTNTGTLFLSNIQNFNEDGFSNTGTVVYGDGVSAGIIAKIKNKTTGNGGVLSQEEYDKGQNPTPNSYAITYELNGGEWVTNPDSSITSYTPNDQGWYTFEFDAPFDKMSSMVQREHYNLKGWTCEEKGVTEPSLYFDLITDWKCPITLKANWYPQQYYVFYYFDGGYVPDDVTSPEIVYGGEANTFTEFNIESESFTLPTPVKDGYTFAGWGLGGTDKVFDTVTIPKGTTGNVAYTAKWTANGDTPYKVKVYYMDENGNYPDTPAEYDEKGVTDSTVTIPSAAYEQAGFTYDSASSNNSGVIAADGSLTLSLYYKRNQYDITFKSYDGKEVLYSYKGYYDAPIKYDGSAPQITDEDYTYTFLGWSIYPEYDFPVTDLGKVRESKTYYAAFAKDANFCTVDLVDLEGFMPLEQTSFKLKKGQDFKINLTLADEKYYVGTNELGLTYKRIWVHNMSDSERKFEYGKDYSFSYEGIGKPVVLSIPNVTDNLEITFYAAYHEEHDYSPKYDTILKEATCTEEGLVQHLCYKCGKTSEEVISPTHSPATEWTSDETGHWHTCSNCTEKLDFAAHTSDNGTVTKEPTETEEGIRTYKCTVCDYVIKTESIPVISEDHTHNYNTVWSSDNNSHWHECDCGDKTDVGTHVEDSGVITVQPTNNSTGLRTYSCTVCGYVMHTETIPALRQDYYPNYNIYNDFNPFIGVKPSYSFEQIKLTGKISKNNVILKWTDVEDADKYTVYQLVDGKYKAIKTTAENTYTVKNLPTGKYKFIVRYTVDGRISPISKCNSLNVNIQNSKPYPVATVKGNIATLKWQPVDNAEKYAIYLVKDGKAAKLKETEKRAAAYVLESGKEYQFAVSAYVDGKWTTMKTSDIVKVTAEE